MKKEIQILLQELKAGLKQIYGKEIKKLVLYGSYARKEEETGSDVDILLVLKDFEEAWEEIKRTEKLVANLSLKYNMVVSVIPMREKAFINRKTPLILNVVKEGISI